MPEPVSAAPPTVLVVDDQRVARRLVQRILSGAGYRTFEAESGAEALTVLAATGRVSLVIVDVVMPRLNGAEFVRELLARWPDQRVLYMSAYPAELLAQYQAPDLEVPFLAKPFIAEALLVKVAEALRWVPKSTDRQGTP